MSTEHIVNVTYRGLEVGSRLRLVELGPTTGYLETAQPMPVGTALSVQTDDGVTFDAEVLRVQEQVAGAEQPPGMRVRARLEGEVEAWWKANAAGEDPVIPEPMVAVQEPADAPVEAEATEPAAPSAPEEAAAAEASGPSDGVPDAAPSEVSAKQTAVMDVSEIQAVIAAGGDVADLVGEEAGGEARPTEEMAAVDPAAAEEAAKAAEDKPPEDKPNGKKKKRRRRKRKTKSPS